MVVSLLFDDNIAVELTAPRELPIIPYELTPYDSSLVSSNVSSAILAWMIILRGYLEDFFKSKTFLSDDFGVGYFPVLKPDVGLIGLSRGEKIEWELNTLVDAFKFIRRGTREIYPAVSPLF